MTSQYEFCAVCDWATGNAWRGDGSLYAIDRYEIYTSEDEEDEDEESKS